MSEDKIRIDVEDALENIMKRIKINSPLLRDIDFYFKGQKVIISESEYKNWEDTGLLNTDFIIGREWE